MSHTILFSPVGGTDPISENNCHDGSLLHICRVYHPDIVILYMSKEILEKQNRDDRYKYAIKKLYEHIGYEYPEVREIQRPDLDNVHEFDYFFTDFQQILNHISEEKDDTDELLINISSGTPAMKSGLLVLETLIQSMGQISTSAKMIQVATPLRSMSEHTHSKEYDNEMMWELNEDNNPEFINRCREVSAPTLLKIRNEEIIKQQIAAYDYRAALDIASAMPLYSKKYLGLLEMASNRMLLDFSNVDKLIATEHYDCLPVKNSGERKYFEYALNMDIKFKRKEYPDFVLRMTPLMVGLFELVLKKQCGVKLSDYTREPKPGEVMWDSSRLNGTRILDILKKEYGIYFKTSGFVYSDHLNTLIQELSADDRLKTLADEIRDIEKNLRNRTAHQMVSITPDVIKYHTGFTGNQIMAKIKSMFAYTGINVKKEDWESYDRLNEEIIRRIEG